VEDDDFARGSRMIRTCTVFCYTV